MTQAAMKTTTQEIVVEDVFPRATIVTWTLVKVDGGTRLRLVHSGFVTPKNDPAFWNMSNGWKKVVSRISSISDEQLETTDIAETRK
jgi:hypothetical protein